MLKLYARLQRKVQAVELRLSLKLERSSLETVSSCLFYLDIIMLNLQLVGWQVFCDILKFFIILASDPGKSFSFFFSQPHQQRCAYSYRHYRIVQQKLRTFSLAGLATIVAVSVVSSLVTNLLFGRLSPISAATFGWVQSSWAGGATANTAAHPGSQAGWTEYQSKDAGLVAGADVRLALTSGSTTHSTDADFNPGLAATGTVNVMVNDTGTAASVQIAGQPIIVSGTGYLGKSYTNSMSWQSQAIPTNGGAFFLDENYAWIASYNSSVSRSSDGGQTWSAFTTTGSGKYPYFVSSSTGWSVGSSNSIYKTTNGGLSWVQQFTASSTQNDLYFISSSTGWSVGNNGTIYMTSDGGATWLPQLSGTVNNLNEVEFADANNGWIISDKQLLQTNDGGATWVLKMSSAPPGKAFFLNQTTGWRTNTYGVYKTNDGGVTWNSQYSTSSYSTLYDIFFVDADHGWAVGHNGIILATTNGGSNWNVQSSGTTSMLRAVHFVDANIGWTVGYNSTILKTSDGGSTWVAQNGGVSSAYLEGVYFADANNGWVGTTDNRVLKTIDGGQNWSISSTGFNGGVNRLKFIGSRGWAISGWSNKIVKTDNGGTSWTSIAATSGIQSFYFLNADTGWLVGYDSNYIGYVYKTTDGGDTWAYISSLKGRLDNVYFYDENTGIVTFDDGTTLRTADGGGTWGVLSYPTSGLTAADNTIWVHGAKILGKSTDLGTSWINSISEPFTSIDFISSSSGYAVSYGGKAYRTTDGGGSWQEMQVLPNGANLYYKKVSFVNSSVGWITANDNKVILKTSDGGTTWQLLFYTDNASVFTDSKTGWQVGVGGVIRKTTDGGGLWTYQNSGFMNELFGVSFVDGFNGWAVGNSGKIIHTSDGGMSWSDQVSGSNTTLFKVQFINANIGWASGGYSSGGTILKTENGGSSWAALSSPTVEGTTAMHFIDANVGWIGSYSGKIHKTVDGGATWIAQTSGATNRIYDINFVSSSTGWAVGESSKVLKTIDGGATWVAQTGITGVVYAVKFIDQNNGWVTSNNYIYKTTNGGTTWSTMSSGATYSNELRSINIPGANPIPPTYVSEVIDLGWKKNFANLNYIATITASTTLTVDVRAGNSTNPEDGSWSVWLTNVGNGGNLGVLSGNRFIQYRANLTTSDLMASPSLRDITFNYSGYAPAQSLISSSYNTGDAANVLSRVQWSEGLAAGTAVNFQVRTSPDNANWTDWVGPDGTSGSFFASSTGSELAPSFLRDGIDDQWIQYRATLLSDGVNTPVLSGVTMTYVVNAAPQVANVSAVQGADGAVTVDYDIIDSDTETANNPGKVTVELQYCTANCAAPGSETWATAASTTGAAGAGIDVDEVDWTTHQLQWLARADYASQYIANLKLRVVVNDNEGANNIAYGTTSVAVFDTKAPALGVVPLFVDASVTPANANMSATDDSSLEMKVSLVADLTDAVWEPYAGTKLISLATDPDTVYVQFRDAYNNLSPILAAATPERPDKVIIQDTSNTFIEPMEPMLFVAWKTAVNPAAGFGNYKVYRSENQTDWVLAGAVNDRLRNYYADNSIAKDVQYFYRVITVDADGNQSYVSAIVNGIANGIQDAGEGGGGINPDAVPPAISNIATSAVSTTQATVSWDTDVLSDSTVYYLTASTTDFASAAGISVASLRDVEAGYGRHEVVLSGLEPATAYHFIVRSSKPNGVFATSSTSYSFTTQPGPKILAVTGTTTTNTTATISWTTDIPASSYIRFSTSSELAGAMEVGGNNLVTEHQVQLAGLETGTHYYFEVLSGNAIGTQGDGSPYEFITTADNQPPQLLNLGHAAVTEATAIIVWDTDEPADSRLEYRLASSTEYVSLAPQSAMTISHIYSLTGLASSTKYYYRVSSTDQAGNAASSTEGEIASFTTSERQYGETDYLDKLDQIAQLNQQIAQLGSTSQAQIDALNQQIADLQSQLSQATSTNQGTIDALNQQIADLQAQLALAGSSSQAQINALNERIVDLEAQVKRERQNGSTNVLVVDKTDRDKPVLSGISLDLQAATSAIVSWQSSEECYGFADYWLLDGESWTSGSSKLAKSHRLNLANLRPASEYAYRVSSLDGSGNLSASPEYRFVTPDLPPADNVSIPEKPIEGMASATAPVDEQLFLNAAKKAVDIMTSLADNMSLSTLESALLSQYDALEKLANLVPAPVLGGEPRIDISATTATISWSTDRPANSLVAFADEDSYRIVSDKRKAYGQQIGNHKEYVKEHTVRMSGLKPETVYHFQLRSQAELGQETRSRDFVLKTRAEALEILTDTSDVLSPEKAVFRWLTSSPTNTQLQVTPYHGNVLAIDEARTFIDKALTTTHDMSISEFQGGAVYQVVLSGIDQRGTKIEKVINTFSTTRTDLPAEIGQIQTESALSQGKNAKVQTIITWQTNEPTIGFVTYGKGVLQDGKLMEKATSKESGYSRKHTMLITDFEPGAVYSFQVHAVDTGDNESLSGIHTILAPRQKEGVFDLIVRTMEETFGWVSKMR